MLHFRKDLAASKYQDAVLKDGSVQEHLGVTWLSARPPWCYLAIQYGESPIVGGAFERIVIRKTLPKETD